jgi:hypothetical protein
LIRLALNVGQPVSEVLGWDDRTIATVLDYQEEQHDAIKDANRGR